ncbi:hypothetical protein [Nostoc sp. NOS(2021)]|uniref:hypothetical protein n=1 Tax=Nostoc sp. NOS(2021) TaxID=2815407 RepID=UPI0025E9C2D3|nr:hypothetical protein [Nostoc sp. NOS(2021)]
MSAWNSRLTEPCSKSKGVELCESKPFCGQGTSLVWCLEWLKLLSFEMVKQFIAIDRWQLLLSIPCSLFRIRRDLVMSLDIARFLLGKFVTLG